MSKKQKDFPISLKSTGKINSFQFYYNKGINVTIKQIPLIVFLIKAEILISFNVVLKL